MGNARTSPASMFLFVSPCVTAITAAAAAAAAFLFLALQKGKTQEQHDLAAQIEISIQPVSGAAFSVAVSSAATVGDVKAAIRSAKGLSSGCQHLVKTEEPLDDCQSLRELFVAEKRWLLFLVVNTANSEVAVLFALMQAREGLAALQSWASLRNDMAIEEAQALQLRGVRMTGDHVMELQLGRCQLNGSTRIYYKSFSLNHWYSVSGREDRWYPMEDASKTGNSKPQRKWNNR